MANPDDIYSLEMPTGGWAFLRNGFINYLTKIILVTSPSASAGTVVEISVEHKRGRATGHITVQASAFEALVIQWLKRRGYQAQKTESISADLRDLLQQCYDLLESPQLIDDEPEWREAAVGEIAAYLADHPITGYCPAHGGEVSGEDELISLADHGKCIACHKAWQLKDPPNFRAWINDLLRDSILEPCQEVRIYIPDDLVDGCYTLDLESDPNTIAATWFTDTFHKEQAQALADELDEALSELGFDVLVDWPELLPDEGAHGQENSQN
ncbi:MAG: hypothetical protein HS114_34775 [Anaerolineales bacterium]|nr:hypothetical protein [Anaerolineales bacterium]